MENLATEPDYFKMRRRFAAAEPLAPIPFQKDVITFNVPGDLGWLHSKAASALKIIVALLLHSKREGCAVSEGPGRCCDGNGVLTLGSGRAIRRPAAPQSALK